MKKILAIWMMTLSCALLVRHASAFICPFRTTNQEEYATWAASGSANANTASRAAISYAQANAHNGYWVGLGENSFSLYDPLPKIGLAYMMSALGRTDTWTGFHPASQYGGLALTEGNVFHMSVGWKYLDSMSEIAKTNFDLSTYYGGLISFECASVDNSDTVNRASMLLHENWHVFWENHGLNPSHHASNADGTCQGSTGATQYHSHCDYFYPHHLSDYLPSGPGAGYLGYYENPAPPATTRLNHSPTQINIEYDCDVSQFPASWLPAAAVLMATANNFDDYIINVVAWKCGKPIPF